MRVLACIGLIYMSPNLFATGFLACGKSNLEGSATQLLHLAKIVGQEDRMTFEEYAQAKGMEIKDVEDQFGATGVLTCRGKGTEFQFTAQIAGSSSVVIGAAHGFFNKDCSRKPIELCSLFLFKGKTVVENRVEMSSLKLGGCPFFTKPSNASVDWMVAKLISPAKARPYGISSDNPLSPGQKVLQVSAFSENFRPEQDYPRHITECSLRDIGSNPNRPILTDCDTGGGSSGSAQLVIKESKLYVASIHVAYTGSGKDGQAYNRTLFHNVSVPISGQFLEAIKQAID